MAPNYDIDKMKAHVLALIKIFKDVSKEDTDQEGEILNTLEKEVTCETNPSKLFAFMCMLTDGVNRLIEGLDQSVKEEFNSLLEITISDTDGTVYKFKTVGELLESGLLGEFGETIKKVITHGHK